MSNDTSEKQDVQKTVVDGEAVRIEPAEDYTSMEVNNPRIGKVLSLQEETKRQRELEEARGKRIRQEQEYIDRMIGEVEENLKYTREEQKYNEEFERQIRTEVYRMHGISEDKLEGMERARGAWYQGAAFALFFLSLVMIVLCGVLHGFGSQLCIFMAFYTAIEGTLLSNGRKQNPFFALLTRALYLLLFPVMMVVFVCYELGFEEYTFLVPVFTVAGVAALLVGAVSYFLYDPYRAARRDKRRANGYIRDIEKAAIKEVSLKEKAFAKQERKKEKLLAKAERERQRAEAAQEKRAKRAEEAQEKREKRAGEAQEKREKRAEAAQEKRQSAADWFAGAREKLTGKKKDNGSAPEESIAAKPDEISESALEEDTAAKPDETPEPETQPQAKEADE